MLRHATPTGDGLIVLWKHEQSLSIGPFDLKCMPGLIDPYTQAGGLVSYPVVLDENVMHCNHTITTTNAAGNTCTSEQT